MIPQGFLDAILSDPSDDTPRMVLADWLEENGEPERAELIRVQCELACLGPTQCVHAEEPKSCYCTGCAKHWPLRQRERELLSPQQALKWFEEAQFHEDWGAISRVLDPTNGTEHHGGWINEHETIEVDFRRGFIASLTMTAASWLAHADELTASQPIERVTLTDWPLLYFRVGGEPAIMVQGRNTWHPVRSEDRDKQIESVMSREWARITFTLPVQWHLAPNSPPVYTPGMPALD